ncbi:hypothetical protein [Colwellia polaris]|jgi:hypothetical protein|uniref:hypothetical protein n=1 Tax=Colwellia polaris TaxID=326537 RepID=UPI000A173859|nr:hypothetical protein [Colwellia polaris]|tara:strand:+ start:431 stop:808 length:378 start_codon:yes stop_codon:yes gene_type:complete
MGSEAVFIKLKEEKFTLCFDLMNINRDYKHHWLKLASSVVDMLNEICSKTDSYLGDVYFVHRKYNNYSSLDFNHITVFCESGCFEVDRAFLGWGYGEPVLSDSNYENHTVIYRLLQKIKFVNFIT